MDTNWHSKTIEKIFEDLKADEHGLTQEEAKQRLEKYGPNKLPEAHVDSLAIIFFRQFQSPLIYILLAASFGVFAMGEAIDGSIILAVLIFNAIVGTIQEGKAQNTLLALKKFVETNAVVLRDNEELIIPDQDVVLGDIIILQEGDKIPADARIIVSNGLRVDEAPLTGEAEAVFKTVEILLKPDLSFAEQKNMVFKGAHIVAGNGRAIVTAVGLETIIGKISQQITIIESEIPLKKNIRYLSRLIIAVVALINIVLFSLGIYFDKSIKEMFTTLVSLSVSIIPEGLPIVMTLVLAQGVWQMCVDITLTSGIAGMSQNLFFK